MNEGYLRELVYDVFLSSFCASVLIVLCSFKLATKYFLVVGFSVFFYLCFVYDTGYGLDYHGDYNRKVFVGFLLGFLLLEYFLILVCFILYKKPIITIILIGLLSASSYNLYQSKIKNSCNDWIKGLKGSYIIDDSVDMCIINKPSICWVDLLSGLFNYSEIIGEKCEVLWNGELTEYENNMKDFNNKEYLNYLEDRKNNKDLRRISHIGFPSTKDYKYEDTLYLNMSKKVISEMKIYNMTKEEFESKYNKDNKDLKEEELPEVVIDFTDEKSKVRISIKRNEELVKERKKLYETKGKNNLVTKNLLIFYIDAFSRRHFYRKFPKTVSWLEKYYKLDKTKYNTIEEKNKYGNNKENKREKSQSNTSDENKNDDDNSFHTYQFLKYQSLGFFTQINTIPAFWGRWWLDDSETGMYFLKFFKDNGAITGQTQSSCDRVFFDVENYNFYNLDRISPDHEMNSLSCDPNYYNPLSPYTPIQGPMSIRRRCLHGKDFHDYQLKYMEKFWNTYIDMPKVFMNIFIDAHESSGHIIGYLDEKIYSFLIKNEHNGFLDETNILFIADHGNNMPSYYDLWHSLDYHYERFLPSLFLIVDKKTNDKYGENLKNNEQALLAPWDVYSTFAHMNGISESPTGYSGDSIFKKITNESFNCENNRIPDNACVCFSREHFIIDRLVDQGRNEIIKERERLIIVLNKIKSIENNNNSTTTANIADIRNSTNELFLTINDLNTKISKYSEFLDSIHRNKEDTKKEVELLEQFYSQVENSSITGISKQIEKLELEYQKKLKNNSYSNMKSISDLVNNNENNLTNFTNKHSYSSKSKIDKWITEYSWNKDVNTMNKQEIDELMKKESALFKESINNINNKDDER